MTEQIREKYDMFSDIWRFYKAHAGSPKNWDEIMSGAGNLSRKYSGQLTVDLCVAVINELEREERLRCITKAM